MTRTRQQPRRSTVRCLTVLLPAVLCLAVGGFTHLSHAADPGKEASDSSQSADSDKKSNTEDKQANAGRTNKGQDKDQDIFRPSEEISEDFAVSFPVDI